MNVCNIIIYILSLAIVAGVITFIVGVSKASKSGVTDTKLVIIANSLIFGPAILLGIQYYFYPQCFERQS